MAADWLRRLELTDPARVLKAWPYELSGGSHQRVMLAITVRHPSAAGLLRCVPTLAAAELDRLPTMQEPDVGPVARPPLRQVADAG